VPVGCNGIRVVRVVGEITLGDWVSVHPTCILVLFHRRRRSQYHQRRVAFLPAKSIDVRDRARFRFQGGSVPALCEAKRTMTLHLEDVVG
jgi:hypothetical protein